MAPALLVGPVLGQMAIWANLANTSISVSPLGHRAQQHRWLLLMDITDEEH